MGDTRWKHALQFFIEMQDHGSKPNIITYNALIMALEKGCQWKLGLQIFVCMQKPGTEPNIITHNRLIRMLGKASQYQLALKQLLYIEKQGINPDMNTENALIMATDIYKSKKINTYHDKKRQSINEKFIHYI